MPEPVITPLAAFGLAMAILNFFISTIQTTHERWNEITDYKDAMRDNKRDLYIQVAAYCLWLKTWGSSDEQIQQKCFGSKGWDAIKDCKNRIEDLARVTADLLCLKKKPLAPLAIGDRGSKPSRFTTGIVRIKLADGFFGRLHRSQSQAPVTSVKIGQMGDEGLAPADDGGPHTTTEGAQAADVGSVTMQDEQAWKVFVDSISGSLSEQSEAEVVEQTEDSWKKLVTKMSSFAPPDDTLRRIIGMFGRNKVIRTRVSELEKAVKGLAELTKNGLAAMGHSPVTNLIDAELLRDAIMFGEVANALADAIRRQNNQDLSVSQWFLELGYLDHVADAKLAMARAFERCDFSFVAKLTPIEVREVTLRRLTGMLLSHDEHQNRLPLEAAVSEFRSTSSVRVAFDGSHHTFKLAATETLPTLITKNWRALLDACYRDEEVWAALRLARARFALVVTFWIMLLWETDWFDHVCACAFRCALFPPLGCTGRDEETKEHRQEHIYMSCSYRGGGADAIAPTLCRLTTGPSDRLHHLGMLLSELVLGQTIFLASGVNNPAESPGTIDTVLASIKRYPVAWDAIDFCFSQTMPKVTEERMNRFIQRVFEPVLTYYKAVRDTFHRQPANSKDFLKYTRLNQDDAFENYHDAIS